jgi:hypothetical protein
LIALVQVPSLYHLLAAPYATPIVILVPTTVILGLIVERHLERVRAAEAREARVTDENAHIKEEIAKLRDVNVDLAGKVVGADATFQRLYRYAKFLNVSDVQEIYSGLTLMLVEVLGANLVSVWAPKGNEMQLLSRRGQDERIPPFKLDNLALAYFDPHGVLSLHDVPEANRYPGLPYLVGKILQGRGGPLVGYLTVEKLPFSRYNAEAIRFFTLAVDWASNSVGNAAQIQSAAPDKRRAESRSASISGRTDLEKLIQGAGKNLTLSKTIFEAESGYRTVPGPQPPKGAVTLGVLLEEVDRYLRDKEGS